MLHHKRWNVGNADKSYSISQNSPFQKVWFLWLLEKIGRRWWAKLSGNFSANVFSQGFTAPQRTSHRTLRSRTTVQRCSLSLRISGIIDSRESVVCSISNQTYFIFQLLKAGCDDTSKQNAFFEKMNMKRSLKVSD